MGKEYVRDPKALGGNKFVSAEDHEDCAQEKLIQEWLRREGSAVDFDFKHITSKGTARNTLVKAQVRLDAQIQDDSAGTFADLIAGSDGRDLYSGGDDDETSFTATEKIYGYLSALNFNEGEIKWLVKKLKSSMTKSETLSQIFRTDSEW